MNDLILLPQEPVLQGGDVEPVAARRVTRKGLDRQGCSPSGQVGIDGPASVFALGRFEETHGVRDAGWCFWPALARAMVTKLVSGVASRYPPVLGCRSFSMGRMRRQSRPRSIFNGFQPAGERGNNAHSRWR